MSNDYHHRMALFHHRKAQTAAATLLAEVCENVRAPAFSMVEHETSLELCQSLESTIRRRRRNNALSSLCFPTPLGAVEHLSKLSAGLSTPVFQPYINSTEGGFFHGTLEHRTVLEMIHMGIDGIAVTLPALDRGIVLWEVIDDPLDGDFYELEWWGDLHVPQD